MVTVASPTEVPIWEQDFYYWSQFSRFVDVGARVIASSGGTGPLDTVAFLNPDHSTVLVVLNSGNFEGHIVQWDGDNKTQKTAWLVRAGKPLLDPRRVQLWVLPEPGRSGS